MVVVVVVPRKTDTVQQTITQRLLDVLVLMDNEHEDVCIKTTIVPCDQQSDSHHQQL